MSNRYVYLTTPHPLSDGLRAQHAITEVATHLIVQTLAQRSTMRVTGLDGFLEVRFEMEGVQRGDTETFAGGR